jgi:hypothetical protein
VAARVLIDHSSGAAAVDGAKSGFHQIDVERQVSLAEYHLRHRGTVSAGPSQSDAVRGSTAPGGFAMQTTRFAAGPLAATLAGATLALSLASNSFAAAPRCETPRTRMDLVACEKAKESPTALRRYVTRTQALYQLYYWDYITPEEIDRYYARQQAPQRLATHDKDD